MNVDEIKAIVKLMSDNDLTEFKVEAEDYNLCIKRGGGKVQAIQAGMVAPAFMAAAPAAAPVAVQPIAPTPNSTPEPVPAAPATPARTINSPLVGTFYRSPGPDAMPFVKVGDKVTPESVVCIIEAMKVMNEVKAETAGTIKDILTTDGTAVEYGQPLFVIE
ncbi:MAG: acetyl-CoA carboxylase biotin carboxyl carrier protein [Victivallaceae bacterium]|nr:acetyl-CoA carboxylase biotin carboxyl carrier protein [Victivallaceae bacterium]